MCNLFLNVLNYVDIVQKFINTILFYLETLCLYPSYYTMPFENVHFSSCFWYGCNFQLRDKEHLRESRATLVSPKQKGLTSCSEVIPACSYFSIKFIWWVVEQKEVKSQCISIV